MASMKALGIAIESYRSAEIDEYAKRCASHNFPEIVHVGSVTELDGTKYEGIDLLIG